MHSLLQRWLLVLPTLALGWFIVSRGIQWRTDYWLLRDAKSGLALITGESWAGHGVVYYEYEVSEKKYAGSSQKNWRDEKYRNVGIGGRSSVYFSASHPWLSSLYQPDAVGYGWPVVFIALVIELFLVTTVINPKNKWALKQDAGRNERKTPNRVAGGN